MLSRHIFLILPSFFNLGAGIVLTLIRALPKGDYNVVLRVADTQGLEQDNVVMATVCDCTENEVTCKVGIREGGIGLPGLLVRSGAVLLLLCTFVYKIRRSQNVPSTPDFDRLFFYSLFCVKKTTFELADIPLKGKSLNGLSNFLEVSKGEQGTACGGGFLFLCLAAF